MQKKLVVTFLFVICNTFVYAQKHINNQVNLARARNTQTQYSPFNLSSTPQSFGNTFVLNNNVILLDVIPSVLAEIENNEPDFLSVEIPISNKNILTLELIPHEIFAPGHRVLNSLDQESNVAKGVFYKGIIKGDESSIVSINIIEGEISGIISNNKGNFNLGKLNNSSQYVFYNDYELSNKPAFNCDVSDEGLKQMIESEVQNSTMATNVACGSISIYIEADNALYINKGSTIANANNFVNTVFSQVAVLYDNEGIQITISQTKIWNTVDPYASVASTTSAVLSAFRTQVSTTFNGHLGHLFSTRNLGGGRAGLNVLCAKGTGVSGNLSNSTPNVPTYSWNVMVVTHELGHNFGSPHTHSCTWPNGAIDNCATTEGGCSPGPAPTNGGTIMSYCHTAGGINFALGFGMLPGNLIRNRTQTCIGSAVAPSNLSVIESYNTSAVVGWDHEIGGTYTLEYRTGAGSWTTMTTAANSTQISGLTANTNYEWRVKVGCSGFVTSTFSTNSNPSITYCSISHTTGCNQFDIGINDIIVGGENFSPNSGCTSSGGYKLNFSPIKTLTIGRTYSLTINQLWIGGNPVQATIWVDLNKNGTFESTEKLFNTTASFSNTAITGSFTIPAGSQVQSKTRMRVILRNSTAPTNPCLTNTYGESEDFIVNISNGCPQTVDLLNPANNITSGDITHQASSTNGTINARNHIINTNTKATYRAKTINLNPGFSANNGTIFRAEVGGCN